MTEQPGANRRQQVDERSADVAEELLEINDGDVPKATRIRGQEFDNRQWLLAELEELGKEESRLRGIVSVDGTVNYD